MITYLLEIQTMGLNHFTEVIPSMISQYIRNRKDTLTKKNILKRNKNMTTHHIFIVNQAMRLRPIKNLMTSKASLSEMTPQLKMLKTEQLNGLQYYQIDMYDH